METNENFEDGFENKTAMVVLGIRDLPSFKMELEKEARERGENFSEYGRRILRDRHNAKADKERLKELVVAQHEEIEKLETQVAADAKQFKILQAENDQLREQIEMLNNQLTIYSDKRLLYLYHHMKGKKDRIVNAYSDDFDIVYDTPHQVLLALIYSCKLKQ